LGNRFSCEAICHIDLHPYMQESCKKAVTEVSWWQEANVQAPSNKPLPNSKACPRAIVFVSRIYHLRLAVAESITTGNLQAAIGSVSGSSTYFECGMTVYSRRQKVEHLGVNDEHAREVNSVSARVAQEMARGICLKYDVDVGIGTTGYAEPHTQEGINEPHGYFAIWHRSNHEPGKIVMSDRITGAGLGRVGMQQHMTTEVLRALLKYLKSLR
jgi:nicotinamide-nucleotide amidase